MSSDPISTEMHALGEALSVWFAELDTHMAAEQVDPWARELAPVFGQPIERLPLVDGRSVAAALYTGSGRLISATPAFVAAGCDALVEPDRLAAAAAGREPAWIPAGRLQPSAGPTTLLVYASSASTITWRLPTELHAVANQNPRSVVVLTAVLGDGSQPLRDACIAHGLSGLQTRVALASIRLGGIKPAAESLGLSYQTAREAASQAMTRVGVRRLPELVTRLTTLAFGVFPGRSSSRDVLADVWGLTERQIAISGMLAEGASRQQIARLLKVSLALVKKELDAIYPILQVGSSAALASKLVEARALSWLTAATAGGVGFVEDQSEPLRFALRPDGGRIAFSDYGPASGRPVLVLHSSMTTRIVSRKLLRALHRAGFRPIAIDRPGFGLTEPLSTTHADHDPFVAAASDVTYVLAHLRIRRVDVVSRGAAQFLVALARASPKSVDQVVLINPGPPYRHSGRGVGPLAVMKDAFVRNPSLTRPFASFLASQLTYRRLERMLPQWTRGSPPDEQAARDPEFVADFFRSVRMFATGRFDGFVREQAAIALAEKPAPFKGAAGWRVLLGSSDVLYEPDVVLAYWRELLPGARFDVVAGGGRFLAMTHADRVVAALDPD